MKSVCGDEPTDDPAPEPHKGYVLLVDHLAGS